jgi:NAD(P)-dependent dehydrogenase (short-subunit alcohol dehydrogenase family)
MRTVYKDAVRPVSTDVSSQDGADAIIEAAVRELGKLSFCVNNAAVAPHTSLLDETVRVWDTV